MDGYYMYFTFFKTAFQNFIFYDLYLKYNLKMSKNFDASNCVLDGRKRQDIPAVYIRYTRYI